MQVALKRCPIPLYLSRFTAQYPRKIWNAPYKCPKSLQVSGVSDPTTEQLQPHRFSKSYTTQRTSPLMEAA